MPATNMTSTISATGTIGASGPPSAVITPRPANAPIMYTSPWAKFSSFRIP
jgi:hypothetical protein